MKKFPGNNWKNDFAALYYCHPGWKRFQCYCGGVQPKKQEESIVKKIIEDHGGYIWATSKEGEGTCMHFVIRKYQEKKEDTPIDI